MTYELPNATHRGIDGLVMYVNQQSDGLFIPFTLLILWAIMLVVQLNYGFGRALTTSSFVLVILGLIFSILGMLSGGWLTTMFILLALSLLYRKLSND